MFEENAMIKNNICFEGGYYQMDMFSPQIAKTAKPGQFINLQVPSMDEFLLRRPFSIYHVNSTTGIVSIVYKPVGKGTDKMTQQKENQPIQLLGPLGKGFRVPDEDEIPVIVAGGYGCAATYMLAKQSSQKGFCLMGARSANDLLLVDVFEKTGFDVRVSTNDGSAGTEGLVTLLLEEVLSSEKQKFAIYSCGPNPMMKAVGEVAAKYGFDAELSVDNEMCCGVGACFTCVVKIKNSKHPDGWEYQRTCKTGPVFDASQIIWS